MSETAQRELTYGEKAVGLTFNPGGSPEVHEIKSSFAGLIDDMAEIRRQATDASDNEKARLASIAITELQGAQMWAIKALTWNT